jgi:LysR family hca operon transcriptional activator
MITPSMRETFAMRIKAFRMAYPNLRIRVGHRNVSELHCLLKAGEIDVAFTRPFHADAALMERHLEWHDQVLAIPADHPWTKRSEIPWSLLTGASVLLIDPEFNPLYGQNFLHMCGRHRCTPKVDYAASDLPSLIFLVATGCGVCPYPGSLAEWAPTGVVFRPFKPASRPMELVLMWASKNESPLLRAFIESFDESPPAQANDFVARTS